MQTKSMWGWVFALVVSTSGYLQGAAFLHETVSDVYFLESGKSQTKQLEAGTPLPEQVNLRTAKKGLAEVRNDTATLRLGSETSVERGETGFKLLEGNLLFQGFTEREPLRVFLDGGTALVSGDTGFAQATKDAVTVGGMAGETIVQFHDETYNLSPGELIVLSADRKTARSGFNLAKQAAGSRLVHGFKGPLPELGKLTKEVSRWSRLQARGFVRNHRAGVEVASARPQRERISTGERGTLFGISEGGLASGFSTPILHGSSLMPYKRPTQGHGIPDPPHNPNGNPHDRPPGNSGNNIGGR